MNKWNKILLSLCVILAFSSQAMAKLWAPQIADPNFDWFDGKQVVIVKKPSIDGLNVVRIATSKLKTNEELMELALETTLNNPPKFLKWPYIVRLSPKYMSYYFDWNTVTDWKIDNNSQKPKVEWNLQYLIWETGVWSYENLSPEHKEFIQKLADLILTDEYAKNIEENKRNNTRNYEIVSSWEKDLKTSSLGLFIKRVIFLLQDIDNVISWVDSSYDSLLETLKKYEWKKWYNTNMEVYELLETLKPEIEWVLAIHKLLDEKIKKTEMDFKKRGKVISDEIKRIEEEIKKNYALIRADKKEIRADKNKIRADKKEIEEIEEHIAKMKNFIKVANRFLDVNWRSQ